MLKNIMLTLLYLIISVALSTCTSVLIIGRHNTVDVDTEAPIGISPKMDSIKILNRNRDRNRNKPNINDTINN